MGLDPIKWILMYILNEDGVRNRSAFTQAKKVHGFAFRSLAHLILSCQSSGWQEAWQEPAGAPALCGLVAAGLNLAWSPKKCQTMSTVPRQPVRLLRASAILG